jgi:hypothetical protein
VGDALANRAEHAKRGRDGQRHRGIALTAVPPLEAELTVRRRPDRVLIGMWVALVVALPIWTHFEIPGWDLQVYAAAIHSLRAGHDPYADAMAIQQVYHDQVGDPNGGARPYSYVYSPITLPVLRLIGKLPLWFSGRMYWLVYIFAVLGQLWVAMRFTMDTERRYFLYLVPAASFFPGLLQNGVVLSGNIAYILYLAVFWCALVGWRRGTWTWFYAAVLAASCIKAPLLSLVVIPALSARRQWISAGLTTAAGIALFAIQPVLWPSLFRSFLKAVDLQFLYNRDFGCSLAGFFSDALFRMGLPYSPAALIFYLCYAVPLFVLLLYLSRRYLQGRVSLNQWVPVLLVGVILLDPRIMEYDVAPITLLLTLIAWRFFASFTTTARTILYLAILFAVTNGIAAFGWYVRKLVDGPLLIIVFAAGCWTLWRQSGIEPLSSAAAAPQAVA